jgi:hypothetical protein
MQVKVITSGQASKVIRPIHQGMEFIGLATLPSRHAAQCAPPLLMPLMQ